MDEFDYDKPISPSDLDFPPHKKNGIRTQIVKVAIRVLNENLYAKSQTLLIGKTVCIPVKFSKSLNQKMNFDEARHIARIYRRAGWQASASKIPFLQRHYTFKFLWNPDEKS